ncbi:hypothetical protein PTTG_29360 [Puccinia triticina 1-1 BBBD Race 1]|uniref:Uncharacterized protein n=1 Tax=Puccinia triticina (isolate 1-1 / race 1 (BBBD)) TaxID=630390 RepID=A0A180G6U9_PUCT1|nr:hypothetical protein PTTG_29360 [Puccinia triticina 1-1 BBBD Race 1]
MPIARLIVPPSSTTIEEELWDPEERSGRVGERQMYPAFATVNLSGLSLSNTPPPNPADAAHLPSAKEATKATSRRGSIVEALATRLFSSTPSQQPSSMGCPADIGRLDEVVRRLDTLRLSLTVDGVVGGDAPVVWPGLLRPYSAPAAGSSIVRSLPTFSPALIGVKQLFCGSSVAAAQASFGDGFSSLFRRLQGHHPTPLTLLSTSEPNSDSSSHHDDNEEEEDHDDGGGDDDGEEAQKAQDEDRRPLVDDTDPMPA